MQNEPNLPTLMYIRYRTSTTEKRKSLQLVTRQRRNFTHKLQKMRDFCTFLTLTHLTPYTTKTYIKFYLPKAVLPGNTLHFSQDTSKEFYPPKAEKMQNEPNFTPNTSSPNGSRATGHESQNMQNEPNLTSATERRATRFKRRIMQNKANLQKLMCLKAPKRTQNRHLGPRRPLSQEGILKILLLSLFSDPPQAMKYPEASSFCLYTAHPL